MDDRFVPFSTVIVDTLMLVQALSLDVDCLKSGSAR